MLLSRLRSGEPEIFASVQGEGLSTGVPSVFVRLAECSLRCSWCDTKYTWDWANHDRAAETVELEVAEIARRADEIATPGVRNAVFTGGEPLLQQDGLAELATALRGAGFTCEVETSGTLVPSEHLAGVIDQWNVSPKLASSGNTLKARRRPAALSWFAANDRASFKFVVVTPGDLGEVDELVTTFDVPAARVILMPEGTDAATITDRSRWLAELCRQRGFRLGTRLHVLLWGAERGR